jgi:tetratricopeptide (TPR) repeat protein
MAFGFGFNKQKVLSNAERCVQQGKLQNAIAEYERIIKADPKDLTVLNTIGDLYARLGQNDRATECFKNVGDAYAGQGFTVKAIAMYKKISKLKPTLESVLKLAELYTQQGLFNDARAQYLQVAEEFLRAGELEQAVRIFQKTLEMDPENVAMKVRLAEVYVRLGKKDEAWKIFSEAAEMMRSRGSLDAAEDLLKRMLTLDPNNSYALLLRGKNAVENGDSAGAIKYLERIADLDAHPDGLKILMNAYLQVGRLADAGTLAGKLLSAHNDLTGMFEYAESLMRTGAYFEALHVYEENSDRMLAADAGRVLEQLHGLIGHCREDAPALTTLLNLLKKAGDSSHLSEVIELLAHASVQAGDYERARDLYLQLSSMEPQNTLHTRNYQQMVAKIGGASGTVPPITAEEGAMIVDELEATAPSIEQHYPDEVAVAIRAALTDAELFISYNMPGKALGPLLAALPMAPQDVRLNQRLAALHTRAERFADAAVACRCLQKAYSEAGYAEEAMRYGDLASRYEARTGAASLPPLEEAEPVAQPSAWPAQPDESGPFIHVAKSTPLVESVVDSAVPAGDGEIDLSEEWEGALVAPQEKTDRAAHASDVEVAETIEEIRFYLTHAMAEQAFAALAKLASLTDDSKVLNQIRQEVEAAAGSVQIQPAEEAAVEVEPPAEPESIALVSDSSNRGDALGEFVAGLEAELPADFMAAGPPASIPAEVETQVPVVAAAVSAPMAMAAAAPIPHTSPSPAPLYAARPAATVSIGASNQGASADLNDIFDELKSDLEDGSGPVQEDPENHYNLGVAFREMGLLDEAIGELQKVCQAIDKGVPFSQTMQAYTWLAQCFLDKNVPEAAIRWFERALKLPRLDEEARIALHYELASAYELAHNKRAALAHFLEVYGANIDYRDVAERIKALKS